MAWTREKQYYYEILRAGCKVLSPEHQHLAKKLLALEEQGLAGPDDESLAAYNREHLALSEALPEAWQSRYSFTLASQEHRTAVLCKLDALQRERDQHFASEAIRRTLQDPRFLAACEKAAVRPTRRQASKWNLGRRGAALRAAGKLGGKL